MQLLFKDVFLSMNNSYEQYSQIFYNYKHFANIVRVIIHEFPINLIISSIF